MLTPNSKILVLALSGIGNLIMQSPVFTAIKTAQPGSRITVWVAPRGTRTLAEDMTAVDEVIEAPIKQSVVRHLKQVADLRDKNFDIGIVLSPGQLLKSAGYLWAAGIRQRVGNAYPLAGQPASSFLLTDSVPELPDLHDIEQNLRLLEPLGIVAAANKLYVVNVPATFKDKAEKILAGFNINPDQKLLGIHAGSAPDFLWKRWPLERFAAVAAHFIKQSYCVLIFGGPDEQSQKQELAHVIGEGAHVIESGLLTAGALFKKCSLVLANDSGLMHLAAAVGAKTFGIFGPTDEKLTGPRGRHSWVIRASGTMPVYHTDNNFNLGQKPHQSLLALSAEKVIEAMQK